MVPGFDQEKWVELYKSALLALEHSLMAGRIAETRAEIVNRVAALRDIPGLHDEEHQAIEDALSSLRMLEREEGKHTEEEQRKQAGEALERLRSIRHKLDASDC